MKTFISAFVVSAALVAANPIRSSANLVARQDLSGSPYPRECDAECVVFAKFSGLCPSDSNGGNRTATYECVCTDQYFQGARTCADCAPAFFSNATSTSGIDEFTKTGLAACSSAGFPVTSNSTAPVSSGVTTATGAGTAVVSPTRASGAPVSTSPAPASASASASSGTSPATPAQPTGAASQIHVASGLFAMAFTAGLYVLL